jgi:host factor-I protein
MEPKTSQNIQDTFLNTVRKDKSQITIYLISGVKLTGRIRSFDKYSVLLENNNQEQLIFKHAISTVVSSRAVLTEYRHPAHASAPSPAPLSPAGMAATTGSAPSHAAPATGTAAAPAAAPAVATPAAAPVAESPRTPAP